MKPLLRLSLFVLGLSTTVICSRSVHSDDAEFSVRRGQRQLFLDNHGVAKIDNLTRTMHRPEKRGAVVRSPKPTQTIQTRIAPVWDPAEKHFKIWTSGIDQHLWLSQDGLHWKPGPELNLVVTQAVYDPNDSDPARRYKAVRPNRDFLVSPDGVTWTRLDIPKIDSQDESNFTYDPDHQLFIHSVKRSGPYGRSVAIATSRDFKTWKDYGVVFHADALDQEVGRQRIKERLANPTLKQTEYDTPEHYSVQIYNMGVFHYEGLYIGLPSIYHHTGKVPTDWPGFDKMNLSPYILGLVRKHGDYTGFYNIQLVSSRDLVHWQRLGNREPFIETSALDAGAYDTQTIIGPSAPVVRGDELWFYYTGIKQYAFIASGKDPGYEDYVPDAGAICLAVLRRDGFMSLDAGDNEGAVTTKLFELDAEQFFVNVAVKKHGTLLIEVLDENSRVVAMSKPVTHDHRRGQVSWARGDLTAINGSRISLRFKLRNAGLYSYWLD